MHLDFGTPVLDFIVTEDTSIIVLLDGGWRKETCSEIGQDENVFAIGAVMVQGQVEHLPRYGGNSTDMIVL
jgi:hypothetical protein